MENGKQILAFMASLKACAKKRDLAEGARVHARISERNLLEKRPPMYLASAVIHMYARCGMLAKAREVLAGLPNRDVVSWSALISGYAQRSRGEEALKCFEEMQGEGIAPDAVTLTCILKACGATGCMAKGMEVHEEIACRGLLHKDVVLGNALIDMYAKCGAMGRARDVLRELPVQDAVSWNALISGYAQREQFHGEAMRSFDEMQREGLSPDAVTFACILKACASMGALDKGKRIHNEIVSAGLLGENAVVLGTALVDMYAKCGMLPNARKLMGELPGRDVVSWSALIAGYARHGHGREALQCYGAMQSEGIAPNTAVYVGILGACGCIGAVETGERIHREVLRKGLLEDEESAVLGNALIDMYAKCGEAARAEEVLEALPRRDVVSWSSLIAGYARCEQRCGAALRCFERMRAEGFSPNAVTCVSALRACSAVGAIRKGEEIHRLVVARGWLAHDVMAGTALVDLYAKCGSLARARQVLEHLPLRSTVAWNALLSGYAERGRGEEALAGLLQMQDEGIRPNDATFLCVLSACSHAGLADEADDVCASMTRRHGIAPSPDHRTCMIVGLGSVGRFDRAVRVVSEMPAHDRAAAWLPLLAACRKWGHVRLGMLAFDQAMQQLDSGGGAAYTLMANIFAACGMQEDAESVEGVRRRHAHGCDALQSSSDGPGSAWIDADS